MRKNRTAKFIFNGALLAVMAVLGVTAYQVANKSEHIQEVLPLESTKENDTADAGDSLSEGTDTLTETGTNLVEADMNEASDTGLLDSESLISDAADGLTSANAADASTLNDTDAALNSPDIGESTSVNAQVALHKGPEVNFSEDT